MNWSESPRSQDFEISERYPGSVTMTSRLLKESSMIEPSYLFSTEEANNEALHVYFLSSVASVTSKNEAFMLLDKWISALSNEVESLRLVANENDYHAKIVKILTLEVETWDLFKIVYALRLIVQPDEPMEFNLTDELHINEKPRVTNFLNISQEAREMSAIVDWLERKFIYDCPRPPLKNFNWENTLEALKRDDLLGRKENSCMVTQLDADAVTRQQKCLHPLDEDDDAKAAKGAYLHIRSGEISEAIKFCFDSGHVMRGISLSGYKFTEKVVLNDEVKVAGEPNEHSNYRILGNLKRDLWKLTSWNICDINKSNRHDRASLGALCGHRKAMLDVAQDYDDKLWSFVKTSLDVKIEKNLRDSIGHKNYKQLPDAYWSQEMSIGEILSHIDLDDKSFDLFTVIQRYIMLNNITEVLPNLMDLIDKIESNNEKEVFCHVIRFLTHVYVLVDLLDLPLPTEHMDAVCETYCQLLFTSGDLLCTPFYLSKISKANRNKVVISHIDILKALDPITIQAYLSSCNSFGLDILDMGKDIVSTLMEDESYELNGLLWIKMCTEFTDDWKTIQLMLLIHVLMFAQKYIVTGDMKSLQGVLDMIENDCKCTETFFEISEEYKDTLMRELISYEVLVESEKAMTEYRKVLSQQPSFSTKFDMMYAEAARREEQMALTKWKDILDHHFQHVYTKLMNVLKFPSGWLSDCSVTTLELEEDKEKLSVVRRIVIKKVTFGILKLLESNPDASKLREFASVICEDFRKILVELSSDDIKSIFKVLEEIICRSSKSLFELPH